MYWNILRIKKCEYRPQGMLEYDHWDRKTAIVDGEEYVKEKFTTRQYDLDKSFYEKEKNNEWLFWDCKILEGYGITIREWQIHRFQLEPAIENLIAFAHSKGDIPKYKISNVHYGKILCGARYNDEMRNIALQQGVFRFSVRDYGWGNSINIEMPIRYFLSIPFDLHNMTAQYSIRHYYGDSDIFNKERPVLPQVYFERRLNDSEKVNLAMEIFKYKLKLRTR